MDPAQYGIYQSEIDYFFKYMEEMQRVRDLGGLHVIGSERHESRRIDNQLRGRSARQGDPGSSRFYLSMEDELMRLFGGQQAEGLMQRMRIDEAMPLEVGLVSRIVEQSQTRVEGANFDVRKHLLEYDDVLNTQRAKVYEQRNRIFVKDDLSEDVTEMLQIEILRRVPEALEDQDGPWKLLAWLDQIQPPLQFNNMFYPSYTLRLLLEALLNRSDQPSEALVSSNTASISRQSALDGLVQLAVESLKTEQEHMLHSVASLLEASRERFEAQLDEQLQTVDTFFEGLDIGDEEAEERSSRQILDDLTALVRFPLKLSPEEQRALKDDPGSAAPVVEAQITAAVIDQTLTRLIGAVERRMEEDLDLNRSQLDSEDWEVMSGQILDALQAAYEKRRQRLIGENGEGQIRKDLEIALAKADEPLGEAQLLVLLMQMPQGSRAVFDKRTHRRVWRRTNRLTYTYAAARYLENREPEEISSAVLEHLEGAQSAMSFAWGSSEWLRLAANRPSDLDETTQRGFRQILGEDRFTEIKDQPLQNLPAQERSALIEELGRQSLTEVYRELLLRVISELWVEYLTSMEALRVSIGLEAYAQRDPLVQYKSRAFEMFQELLVNMRSGVVSRMFTYRPRDLSTIQTTIQGGFPAPRPEAPQLEAPAPETAEPATEAAGQATPARQDKEGNRSKRRRRRR
jgi:preprotein translocase subunit SecA